MFALKNYMQVAGDWKCHIIRGTQLHMCCFVLFDVIFFQYCIVVDLFTKYIVSLIPCFRCFSRIIWSSFFILHYIIQITLLICIYKVAIGLLSLEFLCKHYHISNNQTICNIDVILLEIISGLYHVVQHDSCINFCAKLLLKLLFTSHRNQ